MINFLRKLVGRWFNHLENIGWASLNAQVEAIQDRRDQADLRAQFARETLETKPPKE